MSLSLLVLSLAALFLAYNNGGNDNFKGVATLYGSGVLSYRTALALATVTTLLGSFAALFIANGLVSSFSGKGLVPDSVAGATDFLTAVGMAAGITVLLATRLGIPVSTTHALVGALLGAGIMSAGAVNYAALGSSFVLPLVLSPFIAFSCSLVLYYLLSQLRRAMKLNKESCFCVGIPRQYVPVRLLDNSADSAALHKRFPQVKTLLADCTICTEAYTGEFLGQSLQKILDGGHIVSAAAVSFARGLNDTPKIAGLLVAANALDIRFGMTALAIAMALGGLLNARRVAETMSKKISSISHSQGFSANLVTSVLVIFASRYGVPVSTTHVSVGSIFGISVLGNNSNTIVIRAIILSWVVTLPVAAVISAMVYLMLNI